MNTSRFSLFSVLLFLPSFALAQDAQEYRITEVEGPVGIVPQGSKEAAPPVEGLVIAAGDRLVTGNGGRVELATKEGTVLELREHSNLEVQELSENTNGFFLSLGRLLGRFATFQKQDGGVGNYRIGTPVAVAAVRGTELALDVQEDGETQAGVVEGSVAFNPADEEALVENAEKPVEEKPAEETVVETSQGIVIKPNQPPVRMAAVPPRIVPEMKRFIHIRGRVPHLRERWKDLDPPTKRRFRQEALRRRITWEIPPRLRERLERPSRLRRRAPPPRRERPPLRRERPRRRP